MKSPKSIIFLLIFVCRIEDALSKEISYDQIENLVRTANPKVEALKLRTESARLKTGFLTRSFIPEVQLSAGHENFNSDPLGHQNTQFFGVNANANIFNGMADHWEEEKRQAQVDLRMLQNTKTLNDIIYEAKETYLSLWRLKNTLHTLEQGLKQIRKIKSKVSKKISSGVIAKSDLTSINLMQIAFEENIRQTNRNIFTQTQYLRLYLGNKKLNPDELANDNLENLYKSPEPNHFTFLETKLLATESLLKKYASFSSDAKKLPSLDIFANYARVPFSAREFVLPLNRMEWQAGVRATWELGAFFENDRLAKSLETEATFINSISSYTQSRNEAKKNSLIQKLNSLQVSIKQLSTQKKTSQSFYEQVSNEYLRGVKSTSDLTNAFNQALSLDLKHYNLIVEYHLAQANLQQIRHTEEL